MVLNRAERSIIFVYALLGVAVATVGLIAFGWQIISFLKAGEWTSLSIIDIGRMFTGESWFYAPAEWKGLHSVLSYVPFSLISFVFGWWIAYSATEHL